MRKGQHEFKAIFDNGSNGKTGTYVVEMLLKRGHAVRAFVHKNDERSSHLQQQGAELVVGDMHNFMTMCYALEGVAGAYFVYPGEPGTLEATALFAQAAKEVALPVVVNMSMRPARREAKSHLAFNHWIAEQVFGWSGLAVTYLKPVFFAENFLIYRQNVKRGLVQLPYGDGSLRGIWQLHLSPGVQQGLRSSDEHCRPPLLPGSNCGYDPAW